MREIKYKKKRYAKKIIDLGEYMIPRETDRTKEKHRYKLDVDVRMNKKDSQIKKWIYWGSHNTIEKCLKEIEKSNLNDFTDLRVVESKTGLILKQFKL